MLVSDILKRKGNKTFTIEETKTVQNAVDRLVEHNIGSLLVLDASGKVTGIITERDVLRESSRSPSGLAGRIVRDAMTTQVVTGAPEDYVKAVQKLMLERRIRHLPIVSEGHLVGMVSIGDVMMALLDATEAENYDLHKFLVEKNVVA